MSQYAVPIITFLVSMLVGVLGYVFKKNVDDKISKLEESVDHLKGELAKTAKIDDLKDEFKDLADKLDRMQHAVFEIAKENVAFKNTTDNLKALETYVDKMNCPGLDECRKMFSTKDETIKIDVLKQIIETALSNFELKLIKSGTFTTKEK